MSEENRRLRVMIIGGYGLFGGLLAEQLACEPGLEILLAGRDENAARAKAEKTSQNGGAKISGVQADALSADFIGKLREIAPDVVVHTSGPFQAQDYSVARACVACGITYIDLADGRDFVANFSLLDADAKQAGATLITGASTLPALSGAAVDFMKKEIPNIRAIDMGITPGNRTRRGLATVRAILSYCGAPVRVWRDGEWRMDTGWRDTVKRTYPAPVGARLFSCCDVPDLALFPERYAPVESVTFRAGLEIRFLHRAMNLLAWFRQKGLVQDWSRHAGLLFRLGNLFQDFGTDAGGMHVRVDGENAEGKSLALEWHLIAEDGDGPQIPAMASAALIRKLLRGERFRPGAYPCLGLLDLKDFDHEFQNMSIRTELRRA